MTPKSSRLIASARSCASSTHRRAVRRLVQHANGAVEQLLVDVVFPQQRDQQLRRLLRAVLEVRPAELAGGGGLGLSKREL